jgi:hypothetical protein
MTSVLLEWFLIVFWSDSDGLIYIYEDDREKRSINHRKFRIQKNPSSSLVALALAQALGPFSFQK